MLDISGNVQTIALIISFITLIVNAISVICNGVWERKNRKNDIKPILLLNFVECYDEGNVYQIKFEFSNEIENSIQFYLKLKNIGRGIACKIRIYYKDSSMKQIMSITYPLTIDAKDEYTLTILAMNILVDNEFRIDCEYEDIDGNKYYVFLNGIYVKYGEEFRPKLTITDIGDEKELKPDIIVSARYIEIEM